MTSKDHEEIRQIEELKIAQRCDFIKFALILDTTIDEECFPCSLTLSLIEACGIEGYNMKELKKMADEHLSKYASDDAAYVTTITSAPVTLSINVVNLKKRMASEVLKRIANKRSKKS